MTREDLIEKIIDRRINEIYQGGGPEGYLRELFYFGNTIAPSEGYAEMSDEDLLNIWNDECDSDDELVEALDEEEAA
jgi:hypothetical protein